jgi:hypothetical protein
MKWLAPLIREADIWHLRWALREMSPTHPHIPRVVLRLRNRLDERHAQPPSVLVRVYRWL